MTRFIRFKRSSEIIKFDAPVMEFAGNAFLPTTAFIPLVQHSGIPSKLVVNPGDRVREGQLIARGTGNTSSNIHASIPGIITEICTIPYPDGTCGPAAVIKLEGAFDILGRKPERFPWKLAPASEILRVLEDKGVINTFEHPLPLISQLRSTIKTGNPSVVLRLFDIDPTCLIDSFLTENKMPAILEGTGLITKSLSAKTVYIVHNNKKWQLPKQEILEELFPGCKVHPIIVKNTYPSGNICQFSDLIPGSSRIFIDTSTAIAAYDAVVHNLPVLHRFLVIGGPALDFPKILKVRIGTPIGDIIEECGGFKSDPSRIIMNGLLMGNAVYDLDTPITKYSKSLHVMDLDSCPSYKVRECIHCGRCLQVCPVSIDPIRIVIGIKKEVYTPVLLEALSKCQFCGCCAIVCPSRISLHQIMKEALSRKNGEKNE